MNKAWFEYKGINSLDMHLRIVNDIAFPSPEADIELVEVLGKDGEVAIDNERLKGVNFPIPVQLRLPENMDVNTMATKISEWLKTDIGWHPLRFSGSEDYEYIAICYEQFNIQETLKRFGKTVINFRLKPYKRKKDKEIILLANGIEILNLSNKESYPLINIEGSGDMAIKNNNKDWLILTNVQDYITVDSEMMSVHKGDRPEFNKMNSNLRPLFPILSPGKNVITWTGNITKIEIDPRWGAIL